MFDTDALTNKTSVIFFFI